MKDGTIFGTKEAHVRATTLCVRQSLEPFLSDRLLRNHSISDTFGGFSYSYAIAAECKFGTWHCHTDARQTLLNIPRKACIKYKVCDGGHLLLHEAVRLALIGYFADALWPPICLGGFNFTVQGYIFLRLLKILIELFSIWILDMKVIRIVLKVWVLALSPSILNMSCPRLPHSCQHSPHSPGASG